MTRDETRLIPGQRLPASNLVDMYGDQVELVPQTGWVHLQFLRFAGCPICNLHLRHFINAKDKIEKAGIREVLVFHSSADELQTYQAELPFTTVADPEKMYYAEFGVEKSARAIANPKVWGSAVRGMATDTRRARQGDGPMPPLRPRHGELGLPADFLIEPGGTLAACQYGRHAADQWTVDELLTLAAERSRGLVGE